MEMEKVKKILMWIQAVLAKQLSTLLILYYFIDYEKGI